MASKKVRVRLNPQLWTVDRVHVGGLTFRHGQTLELTVTEWRRLKGRETKQAGVLHKTLVAVGDEPPAPVHIAEPVDQTPGGGDDTRADEALEEVENDA